MGNIIDKVRALLRHKPKRVRGRIRLREDGYDTTWDTSVFVIEKSLRAALNNNTNVTSVIGGYQPERITTSFTRYCHIDATLTLHEAILLTVNVLHKNHLFLDLSRGHWEYDHAMNGNEEMFIE